ncbi:MAG TPA: ribosome maturation factor RimM [bacterium]|nr:ribosome maturation factor RimM [bacterium]
MPAPPLVVVGRVIRPHGVRGEMRVAPDTDFPERLTMLGQAVLIVEERTEPVRIEAVRRAGDAVLVKIAGIDTPEAAARWRGAALAVPRELAAPLPAGRHYVGEVLGLRVETEDGDALGTVAEILRTPAHDVYVVRGAREILIPAIASVVLRIDPAAGRIIVRLLPGLLEDR